CAWVITSDHIERTLAGVTCRNRLRLHIRYAIRETHAGFRTGSRANKESDGSETTLSDRTLERNGCRRHHFRRLVRGAAQLPVALRPAAGATLSRLSCGGLARALRR